MKTTETSGCPWWRPLRVLRSVKLNYRKACNIAADSWPWLFGETFFCLIIVSYTSISRPSTYLSSLHSRYWDVHSSSWPLCTCGVTLVPFVLFYVLPSTTPFWQVPLSSLYAITFSTVVLYFALSALYSILLLFSSSTLYFRRLPSKVQLCEPTALTFVATKPGVYSPPPYHQFLPLSSCH